MGIAKKILAHLAWSAVFLSGLSGTVLPLAAQQVATGAAGAQNNAGQSAPSLVAKAGEPAGNGANSTELPDSPGSVAAKSDDSQQPGSTQTGTPNASSQVQSQAQAPASPDQPTPQRPLGTAAAEAPNASGVAASQPSGVAIAPAKQHRTRTIVIRIGAIVAAGVALGTVVALTAATPSKPPGAH
jgi:hypothetical protein